MLFNQNPNKIDEEELKKRKAKQQNKEHDLIINEDATYASLGFGEFNENSYKKY